MMANLVKILLFMKEEKLACMLTAFYELSIEHETYFTAVYNKNFDWLKYVWAFGKNYIGSRRIETSQKINIKKLMDMIAKCYIDD